MGNSELDFPFSTEDLKLLYALAEYRNVSAVAGALGKDVTTITRAISALSRRHPVAEKVGGSWALTSHGVQVASHVRDWLNTQRQLIASAKILRIATIKEFSERLLCPALQRIGAGLGDDVRIKVVTEVGAFEAALLEGRADMVISCGKPVDPLIRHRRLLKFPLVAVANRLEGHRTLRELADAPAVEHQGIILEQLFESKKLRPRVAMQFDHVGGVRGACRAGIGWTVLPSYTVSAEIARGELVKLPCLSLEGEPEEMSIWTLRNDRLVQPWVSRLQRAFQTV